MTFPKIIELNGTLYANKQCICPEILSYTIFWLIIDINLSRQAGIKNEKL
jgi:hypothetical protein